MEYYLLTKRIVDPHSGEVLGNAGEQNPPRLMEYLTADHPAWLDAALQTCYQSNVPFTHYHAAAAKRDAALPVQHSRGRSKLFKT